MERKCETLAAKLEAKEKDFWASGGDLSRNRNAIKQEIEKIEYIAPAREVSPLRACQARKILRESVKIYPTDKQKPPRTVL